MPSNITTSVHDTPALAPSTPALAHEPSHIDHESYFSTFALRLLIVLCLGAFASFSLAPYFLMAPSRRHTSEIRYSEGACTAQPQTIDYLQKPSAREKTPPVPSAWTKAGKDRQQFALAQACVAAFTITYETMSIANPASLISATFMLSSTGKKRFFVGTDTEPKDIRLYATWQAQARKEHLQQSAQALNKAQLQTVLSRNGAFSAIFVMYYQLTTKISGKSITQQEHLLVTLAAAPVSLAGTATTWQVTDWSTI